MPDYDALVVGGGHNGLVAAAYLARAGKKTLVLERNDHVGGCIHSAEVTAPGYVHDVYSMNMNLFLASPAWAELQEELEAHGLRFSISQKPYCNVFPDGRALRVYSDVDRTRAALRAHDPEDAEGFERLYRHFQQFQQSLLPLYHTALPSMGAAEALAAAVRAVGLEALLELARIVLMSTRELGDAFFHTPEMKALVATWGLHLDYGPDVSGGGMFPFMETFTDMEEGMAVVAGGARRLPEALAAVIRDAGGTVRTGAEVERLLVADGAVTGVRLVGGEHVEAETVVANVVPDVMARLLADDLPDALRRPVRDYQHGPATMMVHLALDGPAPWAAGDEIAEFAYVHIPPYVGDLAETYTASMNGLLPESPLLIVGQPSAFDSSRAPDGGHTLWIQVRTLPRTPRGDAAGEITARDWGAAGEAMAERVLDKLERYAPGVREHVVGRHVLTPADLERHNPNLVGGDSVGGSHHMHQNFLWRPFPGHSRYAMPVDGLYLCGAATWPGGGNNATSGYLCAQEILGTSGLVKVAVGAAAGAAGVAAAVAGLKKLIEHRS